MLKHCLDFVLNEMQNMNLSEKVNQLVEKLPHLKWDLSERKRKQTKANFY